MEAQRIIITGGATRIGAAIAEKLSGPNKQIVIHYNKSKIKAENLKKKLQNSGSKIYLVKGDLSKEIDIIKIIRSKRAHKEDIIPITATELWPSIGLSQFT